MKLTRVLWLHADTVHDQQGGGGVSTQNRLVVAAIHHTLGACWRPLPPNASVCQGVMVAVCVARPWRGVAVAGRKEAAPGCAHTTNNTREGQILCVVRPAGWRTDV